MSAITRRAFVGASAAAFISSAPSPSQVSPEPARIYTVVFGTAPSRDDTNVVPLSPERMVARLQQECAGVAFTVRDPTRTGALPSILEEIQGTARLQYDGVMIYGWPRDYELLRTGLPTIAVGIVNDFQNTPFPIFQQNRVVAASLDPWGYCADAAVSERMFRDLADKIKLIRTLKRMKNERILTVTDSPYVNVIYGDVLKHPPARYNEMILGAIERTFGTQVTRIGTKEVTEDPDIQRLWHEDSREAADLADRWIRGAQKITYTLESEVLRSAKLYLAMKLLMQKHHATAITFHIRTLVPKPRPEDLVYPALATSEFQLHNQVGKCQSHLNILLSEMLLQYAYGRPSMLGDYSVDVYNNTSCVQHCEGPWNPWGDERRVPYILTDHRERAVRGRRMTGVGAASWVLYPPDEPVTMWQIEVLNREVLVHTGKTIHMTTGPVKYRDHLWEMM